MRANVLLNPRRLRTTKGGFCFFPHRFLRGGFLKTLNLHESVLYLFYVLAGDRNGVSYYLDAVIEEQTGISQELLQEARRGLLSKNLIAYEQPYIQVLSLPSYAEPQMNPARQIRNQLLEKKHDFR